MKKALYITLLIITALSCDRDEDVLNNENNSCFLAEIVAEADFDTINTSNYTITDVELNNDCLKITFTSGGCGTALWKEHLYSTNAFYAIFPIQRDLKMKLINNEVCLAIFTKTVSFNLTPFQIDGQNKLALNIDGWAAQIIYKY